MLVIIRFVSSMPVMGSFLMSDSVRTVRIISMLLTSKFSITMLNIFSIVDGIQTKITYRIYCIIYFIKRVS